MISGSLKLKKTYKNTSQFYVYIKNDIILLLLQSYIIGIMGVLPKWCASIKPTGIKVHTRRHIFLHAPPHIGKRPGNTPRRRRNGRIDNSSSLPLSGEFITRGWFSDRLSRFVVGKIKNWLRSTESPRVQWSREGLFHHRFEYSTVDIYYYI